MTQTPPPSSPALPHPARRNVLDHLKLQGEASAAAIAGALKVTPVAIRQHLQELEAEGLASARDESVGRGRPRRIWSLTPEAARLFPDAHQALAVDLIKQVETLFGEAGLAQLADAHAARQITDYRQQLSESPDLEARLKALVAARSQEGYMAAMARDGEDWLFMENHCPICAAATACTRLCANELEMIQSLLGDDVTVRRDEHILAGARRCLYRISAA